MPGPIEKPDPSHNSADDLENASRALGETLGTAVKDSVGELVTPLTGLATTFGGLLDSSQKTFGLLEQLQSSFAPALAGLDLGSGASPSGMPTQGFDPSVPGGAMAGLSPAASGGPQQLAISADSAQAAGGHMGAAAAGALAGAFEPLRQFAELLGAAMRSPGGSPAWNSSPGFTVPAPGQPGGVPLHHPVAVIPTVGSSVGSGGITGGWPSLLGTLTGGGVPRGSAAIRNIPLPMSGGGLGGGGLIGDFASTIGPLLGPAATILPGLGAQFGAMTGHSSGVAGGHVGAGAPSLLGAFGSLLGPAAAVVPGLVGQFGAMAGKPLGVVGGPTGAAKSGIGGLFSGIHGPGAGAVPPPGPGVAGAPPGLPAIPGLDPASMAIAGLQGAISGFESGGVVKGATGAISGVASAAGAAIGGAIGTVIAPALGPFAPLGPIIGQALGGMAGGEASKVLTQPIEFAASVAKEEIGSGFGLLDLAHGPGGYTPRTNIYNFNGMDPKSAGIAVERNNRRRSLAQQRGGGLGR